MLEIQIERKLMSLRMKSDLLYIHARLHILYIHPRLHTDANSGLLRSTTLIDVIVRLT